MRALHTVGNSLKACQDMPQRPQLPCGDPHPRRRLPVVSTQVDSPPQYTSFTATPGPRSTFFRKSPVVLANLWVGARKANRALAKNFRLPPGLTVVVKMSAHAAGLMFGMSCSCCINSHRPCAAGHIQRTSLFSSGPVSHASLSPCFTCQHGPPGPLAPADLRIQFFKDENMK